MRIHKKSYITEIKAINQNLLSHCIHQYSDIYLNISYKSATKRYAMAKIKLTAGRIASFECPSGKSQAFIWCSEVHGLGVRATPGSQRKRYIFESKIKTKSARMTIGETSIWSISAAQSEARRLQTIIDQGKDPRVEKIVQEAKLIAEAEAQALKTVKEAVTVKSAWAEYLISRKPHWSERHFADHESLMHEGGKERKRSKSLTIAGPLASITNTRLVDLDEQLINEWAAAESKTRPARARLSLRLLRAFLFWCSRQATYKSIITDNAAQSKDAKETLGKAKPKDDALQREQLNAWFLQVRRIQNLVISHYLQALLLTGARPNEIIALEWDDVDFQWNSLTIRDKVDGLRVIPLTPYVSHLLNSLPRRNQYVFSSPSSASGHLSDVHKANEKACKLANVTVTLHGYRRSFASLCEWIEMPAGIAAQIQGHKPQGVREKNYIRRPIDLLRKWHISIEAWILNEAGVDFKTLQNPMRAVK